MDGVNSYMFNYFKSVIVSGFLELKKHVDTLVNIVDIASHVDRIPCFVKGNTAIVRDFTERFHLKMNYNSLVSHVEMLVQSSVDNWRTNYYDKFQFLTNNIKQ